MKEKRISVVDVEDRLTDYNTGIKITWTSIKGLCFLLSIPIAVDSDLEYYLDKSSMEYVFRYN